MSPRIQAAPSSARCSGTTPAPSEDGNFTDSFIFILTMSRCGETGDKAHTVSYCPKKLRRVSSGGRKVFECQDEEAEDPRIPTPMVGHLINRISLANAEREQ